MPGHLSKLAHLAESIYTELSLILAFVFALIYRWGPARFSTSALIAAVAFSLIALYGTIFSITHRIRRQHLEISSKIFEARPDQSRLHEALIDFRGFKWKIQLEKPRSKFDSVGETVWIGGPLCPKCERDLREESVGVFIRRRRLLCPNCGFSANLLPWQSVHSISEALRKMAS